ncbi:MAG: S9 family peptidase [Gammaproteobacteria bacterium]|nr:S9 family peptidase [Gammaproteobacteria bacterium]
MSPPTSLPYGAWQSPLTVEKLTTHSAVGLGQLRSWNGDLFWLESRPQEDSRRVVVRHRDGDHVDVTPADYSVASTVHEYGGVAYCIGNGNVYFVNGKDQNLYANQLNGDSKPIQLTYSTVDERFADPSFDPTRNQLLCVRERHIEGLEAINDIASIHVESGDIESLHNGHDFYAHARTSPDGTKVAFLAWDHPNMPWNGTQLYVMSLLPARSDAVIIAGGQTETIFQPEWLSNDLLIFSSDQSGFHDLYAFTEQDGVYPLTSDDREYGHAMWQLGATQYVALSETIVLTTPDRTELALIDTFSGMLTPVESGAVEYGDLTKFRNGFAYIKSHTDASASICARASFSDETVTIKSGGEPPLPRAYISKSQQIEFSGSSGDVVYAYLYLPKNPDFTAAEQERPPLLVQAHGGPTGRTSASLNSRIQFYTSRGWAVVDVNYSGSTGYGRAYQDRLLNEWGNRDVNDLAACVRHLIAEDIVDPQRVAISGSSAGGFTVLRALTTSNVFKAGASRYGIADLNALAADTHKFESRYIDQLVPEDQLQARSPIHHVDRLQCPVIFSQGTDDKVVPPNQARMMFDALKEKGIPTALFMFEGESHGFRKLENLMACLKGEYYFFSRAFGFEPHGLDSETLAGAELAHMDKF